MINPKVNENGLVTIQELAKAVEDAYKDCIRICKEYERANWSNRYKKDNQVALDCAQYIEDTYRAKLMPFTKPSSKSPYKLITTVVSNG